MISKPIQLIFSEWNYATNTHKNSETNLKIKVKENEICTPLILYLYIFSSVVIIIISKQITKTSNNKKKGTKHRWSLPAHWHLLLFVHFILIVDKFVSVCKIYLAHNGLPILVKINVRIRRLCWYEIEVMYFNGYYCSEYIRNALEANNSFQFTHKRTQ